MGNVNETNGVITEGVARPLADHNVEIKQDFTSDDFFAEVMKCQERCEYIKKCIDEK